jgi:hypothetical protein
MLVWIEVVVIQGLKAYMYNLIVQRRNIKPNPCNFVMRLQSSIHRLVSVFREYLKVIERRKVPEMLVRVQVVVMHGSINDNLVAQR